MKYIANKNCFFKEGTEVFPLEPNPFTECDFALFSGIRVCRYPIAERKPVGAEYWKQEICWDIDVEIVSD